MSIQDLVNAHKLTSSEDVGPKPLYKIVTAENFSNPPLEKEFMFAETLAQGCVGLIVGQGGSGKSFLTLSMAMSVASGVSVCGGLYEVESQGPVLILSTEDETEEIHRRIYSILEFCKKKAAGKSAVTIEAATVKKLEKGLKNIFIVDATAMNCNFFDDNGETDFYNKLLSDGKDKNLKLVIFDTFRRTIPGDESSSETASIAIPLLERFAQETGATVLVVHHISKAAASTNPLDQSAARGSAAITDFVRWQLNIAAVKSTAGTGIPDAEKSKYVEVAVSKNNYGPPQSERKFLKRCEGGVLAYWGGSTVEDANHEVMNAVVGVVGDQFDLGNVFYQTEFKKQFKSLSGLNYGQKMVAAGVNAAIKKNLIQSVQMPNHTGKGKIPMDLIPIGAIHPNG